MSWICPRPEPKREVQVPLPQRDVRPRAPNKAKTTGNPSKVKTTGNPGERDLVNQGIDIGDLALEAAAGEKKKTRKKEKDQCCATGNSLQELRAHGIEVWDFAVVAGGQRKAG